VISADDPQSWPGFALCGEINFLPDYAGFRLWQRKADGVRAYLSPEHLMLRGRRPIRHELTIAGQPVPKGWLLDGEIVCDGPATQVMSHLTGKRWNSLRFEAFDVLRTEAQEMINLPYKDRWSLLQDVLPAEHLVKVFCEPREELPPIPDHWEGVVAKSMDARWRSGRSSDAVKYKLTGTIEAVVMGFERGSGAWSDCMGKVRFGLRREDDSLVQVGVAGIPTQQDRMRFTSDPSAFVGLSCLIKHYGMNKSRLRNPVFVSLVNPGHDNQEVK
jgi:hypothetical protein